MVYELLPFKCMSPHFCQKVLIEPIYYLCLFTAFAIQETFCLHLITELLSVHDWGNCQFWIENIFGIVFELNTSSPDCILFLRNSFACLPYGKVYLGWRFLFRRKGKEGNTFSMEVTLFKRTEFPRNTMIFFGIQISNRPA